jgi:hypothetical protein
MPYTIAIDGQDEASLVSDFQTLVAANTNGEVSVFEPGSFHTAVLETQAYSYRQLIRYLQYAPLFLVTAYLVNVLGLPKREGGRNATIALNFQQPTPQTLRLYEGLDLRNASGANLILAEDLVIPGGTSSIQAQCLIGDGVFATGDLLSISSILPPVTISVLDLDPLAGQVLPEFEGWDSYTDRVSNFVAATPQYTQDSIATLLQVAGIKATGYSQVRNGGLDICVLPGQVAAAQSQILGLNQRYNRVVIVESKPIQIYPDKAGGTFTDAELSRFNAAGEVKRCDQPGRSVFTVAEACHPQLARSVRYEVGDLINTGDGLQKVTIGGNLVLTLFGAMEAGYGDLVRFDNFVAGQYSEGSGYKSSTSYYRVTSAGYKAGLNSSELISVVNFSPTGTYTAGQIVVDALGWGIALNQDVSFPQQITTTTSTKPFLPNAGQQLVTGQNLILFGKHYTVTTNTLFNYSTPLVNLVQVYYHSALTERPIFTRYALGVYRGRYWSGSAIVSQPSQGINLALPTNDAVRLAGNNTALSVQKTYNEIDCTEALVLPACSYFASEN